MREALMKFTLGILFVLLAGATCQARVCQLAAIDISDAGSQALELRFMAAAVKTEYGIRIATIKAYLDSTAKPIRDVFFLVDFQSGARKHMYSAAFWSGPAKQSLPLEITDLFPIRQQLEGPLVPAQIHVFTTPLLRDALNCPSRARVTMLMMHFADGETREFRSKDWHLDAAPSRVPQDLIVGKIKTGSRLAHLAINSEGKAVLSFAKHEQGQYRTLSQAIANWTFQPESINGQFTKIGIPAWIRTGECRAVSRFAPPEKLRSHPERPFVIVDFCTQAGKKFIRYAGQVL
jgi:hypothetical protein